MFSAEEVYAITRTAYCFYSGECIIQIYAGHKKKCFVITCVLYFSIFFVRIRNEITFMYIVHMQCKRAYCVNIFLRNLLVYVVAFDNSIQDSHIVSVFLSTYLSNHAFFQCFVYEFQFTKWDKK